MRLRRIGRNVAQLARAVAFYRDALGFALLDTVPLAPTLACLLGRPDAAGEVATLALGGQRIELVALHPPGPAYPADSDAADLRFQHLAIVVADMPAAYARLCRHGFAPISHQGPQQLPPNTGSVSAFKFRDPDGHPLELIHFPAGVGDPRWQQRQGLFLGIDHSAIAVADATRSIAFYTALGFAVAARSHNHGPAQQRLDGLRVADVDVVALQPTQPGPPHVELLGYRLPGGRGRDLPADAIAADRLVMEVDDLAALLQRLGPARPSMESTQDRQACLLRDPDGHRLLLQAMHA